MHSVSYTHLDVYKRQVHLSLAVVIDPCYAEAVASLRLQQTLQNTEFPILFLMLVNYKSDGIEHFLNGLMKLGLSGIIPVSYTHLLDQIPEKRVIVHDVTQGFDFTVRLALSENAIEVVLSGGQLRFLKKQLDGQKHTEVQKEKAQKEKE